ncbi:hypothetical protein MHK_004953, partial [Candidatus Magnetomorum sp. HK-1]
MQYEMPLQYPTEKFILKFLSFLNLLKLYINLLKQSHFPPEYQNQLLYTNKY